MRIIAGKHSSRKLITLPGNATRPTLDKVRGAVFSSLGGFFEGGVFLDLYAGSGACGLEALSRGMDRAVFVDQSAKAAGIIRKNIEALGEKENSRVLVMKDMNALSLMEEEGTRIDLVYLDPPYKAQKNEEVLKYLSDHDMMTKGARAVIESEKEDEYPQRIGRFTLYKNAVYGITKISYYRLSEEIL